MRRRMVETKVIFISCTSKGIGHALVEDYGKREVIGW